MLVATKSIIENGIIYSVDERKYTESCKRSIYFYKGAIHRENGPAVEWNDGNKYWYKHGKLHREDGPAVEYFNGDKDYYLNGIYYPNVNSPEELIIASVII